MSDLLNTFRKLRRPRILIRAARIGAEDYRRDRDIKRLLRSVRIPATGMGMRHLLAIEHEMETERLCGDTTYSISKHVEILAALVAEAELLKQMLHGEAAKIPVSLRQTHLARRPFADA